MTDLVKVKKDFITLSSLSEEEAGKYESLIYMETEYINSLLKNDGDENKNSCIFMCGKGLLPICAYVISQRVLLHLRQGMCRIQSTHLQTLKMQKLFVASLRTVYLTD